MDLTVSLAVVAALVLGGVGLQAWWSARRSRPRQGPPPGEAHTPSGTDGRQEPSLVDGSPADRSEGEQERTDPRLDEPAAAHPHPVLPGSNRLSSLRPAARLDALIDAIVILTLESAVTGDLAVAHLPASWLAM